MKKIIAVAVLLILFIFALACDNWLETIDIAPSQTQILRRSLEKRTGQSMDGWTLDEMKALEAELDKLEKEKHQAQNQEGTQTAEQSQDTAQESTQSQQQVFESDEGPHKKELGDRNAPSGGYADQEYDYDTETDEPYTDEQTVNKSIEGRWQHPNGTVIEISGSTGVFIAFSSYWQLFADHDHISLGMPAYQNIVPVTDISQILEVNKYPDPANDITANAENFIEIFEGFDYLWRCSVFHGALDGDTGEPSTAYEATFWSDDAILVMNLNGESFMQYGTMRRSLDDMQRFTYYRIK